MEDTGLNFMCPICTKSMINSYDLKFNHKFGICSCCHTTYFSDKEMQLELEENKHFQRYGDKLDARDAFRDFCVDWAKRLRREQELRVEQLSPK